MGISVGKTVICNWHQEASFTMKPMEIYGSNGWIILPVIDRSISILQVKVTKISKGKEDMSNISKI